MYLLSGLEKRQRSQPRLSKSEDESGPGQGTSAGYEMTDGYCVSPPGNLRKEKTSRKAGDTMDRRTRRLLEGQHLAENSAR